MVSTSAQVPGTSPAESATPLWQWPRLAVDDRRATGTAAGIAREVGINPIYVRVSFFVLTLAGGWGIVLYLACWFLMARRTLDPSPYEPVPKGASAPIRIVGFAMVAVGLVVLSSLYSLGFLGVLVWPSLLLGAGVAIVLDNDIIDPNRPFGDLHRQQLGRRVILGCACLFAGVITALALSLSFRQAMSGILVAAFVLIGGGIVFAPMISRMASDLLAERRARIRSEERADMAAHLHDSVLQTLALIQKQSNDSGVVNLARRQERELRTWLFDAKAMNPNLGFRAALEQAMAQVEDLHQVPIEVVVVGDQPVGEHTAPLLQAAREAAANASRHSGAPRVDVFAEVGRTEIEVFVRDTGVGFDLDAVDADRAGIRESIVARMRRHNGEAIVTSSVGEGTEVELRLPQLQVETIPQPVQEF